MPASKPVLIVIAGPNGSGKTEITKILTRKHSWAEGLLQINPDVIAETEFGGWNDRESILKAANRADEIREQCLAARKSLLFETVLSIPEKVDFIRRAKAAGYFIRLIFVATESPEINILRVAWRADQGGHKVPEEKVRSRYEKALRLAVAAAKIVDRAYFVDNSRDADIPEKPEPFTVFRTVDGRAVITYIAEDIFPDWAKNIFYSLRMEES